MSQGVTSATYQELISRYNPEREKRKLEKFGRERRIKYHKKIKELKIPEKLLLRRGYSIDDSFYYIGYKRKCKEVIYIGKLDEKKVVLEYEKEDIDQVKKVLDLRAILKIYEIPFREFPNSLVLISFLQRKNEKISGLLKRL